MGIFYSRPEIRGPNPHTRSGEPPPKLNVLKEKDRPSHRVYDPMSLELHMGDERVRTAGLTQAEREWRQKFLKTEQLHPDEPIHVDAVHRQMNPVRVIYRMPWDYLYKHFLRPTFGAYRATIIRAYVPRVMILWAVVLCGHYYWKYELKVDIFDYLWLYSDMGTSSWCCTFLHVTRL
uniref:Uncharacterized protein n=1 Tax=Meloidogyne enterolobii TaxID=390850 RepID=A0A6V7TH08_MELEN|nr:unnamed protein product [Meloidogyne enterolobii]